MTCSTCQRDNPEGSSFCNACGARLGRDPREYTPPHLRRDVLRRRDAAEGERKQVTVLFVDLKGSVELSSGLDPEDWHRIMDHFLELLTRGIHRFEGTINQYTGDGAMALFGAPVALENHAQRACFAALHLAEVTRQYAQELRRERGLDFNVRMGLNSGDVVVGQIGDRLRRDYTARGVVVGLAARMQQIAEPGRIYLTEHTARLVPGYFEFEDLGRFNVKGFEEPVVVHSLVGAGTVRTRLDLSRARGLSPFVGRQDELRALDDARERAVKGERQVVGLSAAPGLGKSRLCLEWLTTLRARHVPVYEAQCVSHRRMVPFAPVLPLLRSLLGISDRDDPETTRDKIAGRLVRLDPELAGSLPAMFEFLGVPDEEHRAPPPDPAGRERQLVELTRRLLTRDTSEPPVLLFEDLHWIDPASDAFLASLIASCERTGVMFLLNFRPEYEAGWMQGEDARILGLQPLGEAAADALLHDLLGSHDSLGDLARRIRDHTRGNPFFIEEVVRSLVEDGVLSGERGAYRAAHGAARGKVGDDFDLGIPVTVHALLAARIDRLPERERRVLRDAAVLGRRFPEAALRLVAEEDEASLAESLRALRNADFLREKALYPEAEYVFQHGLTHHVALSGQLASRRRAVHHRAALARERIHADRSDEHAALIAHHWQEAGERAKAAAWHRRAAVWVGVNHAPQAHDHWRRVRDLVGPSPSDAEGRALAAEARGQLIVAIGRMGGSTAEADRLFREALALLDARADPAAAARVRLHHTHFNTTVGRASASEATLAEVEALLPGAHDDALEAAWRYLRPMPRLLVRGSCDGVLADLDAAIAFSREHPGAGAEVLGFAVEPLALAWRGYVLALVGRIAEGRRQLEEAIALGSRGHPGAALQAHNCGLALADLLLDPPTALAWGRRSLDLADAIGMGSGLANISYGRACLVNGAFDDAVAAFERGLAETLASQSYAYQELPYRVALARAHAARGDARAALQAAEDAMPLTDGRGFYAADAFLVRALALLLRGADPAAAARDADAARRLFEESGAASRVPFAERVREACARAGAPS